MSNPPGRFDKLTTSFEHDGWFEEETPEHINTTVLPDPARSIISTNQSPDIGFSKSINPYRGCSHACIYCVWGETRVLMADGSTKRIADVKVGDAIFGTERNDWQRHYVKTRVLAHWEVTKLAYRITLINGTELIAGADHRLLTDRGWKFVSDPATKHRAILAPNDRLMGTPERDLEGQLVKSEPGFSIASIQPIGEEMRLFDITTGTEDFIANGVVSHNCYARPSHAYIGLSPGLDFETRLFYKADAAQLLEADLSAKNYKCSTIMLGANTDPYQPLEKERRVTRSILEVLAKHRHPVTITTKGSLVARDVDLLADLAKDNLTRVMFSIPTLNNELKRILEPRAASASAKLKAMRTLADAGVPVGVNVAPIIPVLTEHEIEAVLEAARESGASRASYTILRLPYEVKDLFREWLAEHFPDRAAHVMSQVRAMRGERDNDPNFGTRMHATGPVAQLIRQRFQLAARRLGFPEDRNYELPTHLFRQPGRKTPQMSLDL